MSKVRTSTVAPDPGEAADATVEKTGSQATARLSREEQIRLAAYAAAERRGFEPGSETEDWLEAERQVDAGADGAR